MTFGDQRCFVAHSVRQDEFYVNEKLKAIIRAILLPLITLHVSLYDVTGLFKNAQIKTLRNNV